MLKISLTTSGLLDKRELAAWTRSRREAIHKAVALGMRDSSRSLTEALRTRMQSDLAIRKPAFLRSMRAKVLVDRRYILAAMGLLSEHEPQTALRIMKKELTEDGYSK